MRLKLKTGTDLQGHGKCASDVCRTNMNTEKVIADSLVFCSLAFLRDERGDCCLKLRFSNITILPTFVRRKE